MFFNLFLYRFMVPKATWNVGISFEPPIRVNSQHMPRVDFDTEQRQQIPPREPIKTSGCCRCLPITLNWSCCYAKWCSICICEWLSSKGKHGDHYLWCWRSRCTRLGDDLGEIGCTLALASASKIRLELVGLKWGQGSYHPWNEQAKNSTWK